jgi:biopolymer transport protein ExbD
MAGISVAKEGTRVRAVDHDLPLVPFIDFMVCLIAFLMVTAVWTQMARIKATALVPGVFELRSEPSKTLHVTASSAGFELSWKQGDTVLETSHVARAPENAGQQRFPELREAITKEWQTRGQHRGVSDPKLERAVLHVQNDLPFSDIVGVLDALHAPRRGRASVFDVAFAEN